MEDVHDVAAFLVERLGSMDTFRLQKLLYYSQAWHLAYHGEPLFDAEIQAWADGPVVPSVYAQHRKQYGVRSWPDGHVAALLGETRSFVSWIVERYGGFSGEQLSAFTHAELPWKQARGGLPSKANSKSVIPHDVMATYYRRQLMAPEDAVTDATANARLEGFTDFNEGDLDRMRRVASGTLSPDDAAAELIAQYGRSGRET